MKKKKIKDKLNPHKKSGKEKGTAGKPATQVNRRPAPGLIHQV
jgi:hypothetical protein